MPESAPRNAARLRVLLPLALLVTVALASTVTNATNDYAQDDRAIVLEDVRVHDGGLWGRLLTEPYWPAPYPREQYRPVTSLALAVQYAVGGGHALAIRVGSWILYAAVCVLLYRLARRLLPGAVALAVALIFAAHPVHVEVTALGVGQSELIVALCSLLAALLYHARRVSESSVRTKDWAAIALLYVVAALAKEQGFLLPGMLLLVELTVVGGTLRDRMRATWPGYAALAAVGGTIVCCTPPSLATTSRRRPPPKF